MTAVQTDCVNGETFDDNGETIVIATMINNVMDMCANPCLGKYSDAMKACIQQDDFSCSEDCKTKMDGLKTDCSDVVIPKNMRDGDAIESEAPHYGVFGQFYELDSNADNAWLAEFADELPSMPAQRRMTANSRSLTAKLNLFGDIIGQGRKLASYPTSTFEGPLDFTGLYGNNPLTNFWNYGGSFTTPPCTEAVDFYIMMQPALMSDGQLTKFKDAIGWNAEGGNFRPPQPAHSRAVGGCEKVDWYPYDAHAWATAVNNANPVCQDGTEQSPIDFPACAAARPREEPEIDWMTQPVTLTNNGHTVQITVTKTSGNGGMSYKIGGVTKQYTLVQCHFHYGSEHTVASTQFPFEAHCVHTMDGSEAITQRYGVFGVFFELGEKSEYLAQFADALPARPDHRRLSSHAKNDSVSLNLYGDLLSRSTKRRLAGYNINEEFITPVNFQQLVGDLTHVDADAMTKYWNYDGSFTTPPCTEAVDFYIYMTKATISQDQLDKFTSAIAWSTVSPEGNFRPPQGLNGRGIYGCSDQPVYPDYTSHPWYPYTNENWAEGVGSSSHHICASGTEQSPIDFAECDSPEEQDPIQISWADQAVSFQNNGHTVVLNVADSAVSGSMTVDGKAYRLLQCHFHHGSEHTVGEEQLAFETHCVHQQESTMNTESPHYGVFGLFYTISTTANDWLAIFEDELPEQPAHRRLLAEDLGQKKKTNLFGEPMLSGGRRLASTNTISAFEGPLDFKGLYGQDALTEFWHYGGSFTTPPCTEAVDFHILMNYASITTNQLNKFKSAIGWVTEGGNFRPPQPLNGRVVAGCASVAWYPYDAHAWANTVDGANPICQEGTEQSPIDFLTCNDPLERAVPQITWTTQPVVLSNNGHTVQLGVNSADDIPDGGMTYMIAGLTKVYNLLQCHFHYGSEHSIGGAQMPFEAHCVHTLEGSDQRQRYGVFGAFFMVDDTAPSTFLQQFEDSLPERPDEHRRLSEEEKKLVSLNLRGDPMSSATKRRLAGANINHDFNSPVSFMSLVDDLQRADSDALKHYWNYGGSFTTPPCTEAVDFYIYMTMATLSQVQLDKFKHAIHWSNVNPEGNFRPPQPLHGRAPHGCTTEPATAEEHPWYPYTAEKWATSVGANSHAICETGRQQSPIDFTSCSEKADQDPIEITWGNQKVKIINNGHTVQISVDDPATSGTMITHGREYRLLQCHFHHESEHTVDMAAFPFEVHCVHQQEPMVTMGDVVRGMDFACEDCLRVFAKFSEDECWLNDSRWCGSGCMAMMKEMEDTCTSSHTFMNAGMEMAVLDTLAPMKTAMTYCVQAESSEQCGAKVVRIPRAQAAKFGVKGCEVAA